MPFVPAVRIVGSRDEHLRSGVVLSMILMSDSQEHLYRRFRWRAISIRIGEATFMPRSLLAWLGWAWGQDLWIHGVPLNMSLHETVSNDMAFQVKPNYNIIS